MKTKVGTVSMGFACVLILASATFSIAANSETLPEQRDWGAYIGGGNNNIEMKERAGEAKAALDERINALIEAQAEGLDDRSRQLLADNQEAWVKYADTRARYLADKYRGGSHAGLAYGLDYLASQIERIEELKQLQHDRHTP